MRGVCIQHGLRGGFNGFNQLGRSRLRLVFSWQCYVLSSATGIKCASYALYVINSVKDQPIKFIYSSQVVNALAGSRGVLKVFTKALSSA